MQDEKVCRTCNESKELTEYRNGHTQCKQCDNEHIGNISRARIAERNKAIKKEYEAGKTLQELALEYGLMVISIYGIVHKGRTKPDSRKELKAKLAEFLHYETEIRNHQPVYEVPKKKILPKVISEVKVYNISDLPESERARIEKLFAPYRNSSGRTSV